MFDLVKFWQDQIKKWNEDEKCGLCFEFSATLVNSQMNTTESKTCCVNIFMTDVKFREDKAINSVTQLELSSKCIWNFTLYAVVQKDLGINNYNEQKEYPVTESKWNTVFYPIIQCLGCDNILDYCEILGYKIEVRQNGDATLVHNYLDSNWNGWKINYSITINK